MHRNYRIALTFLAIVIPLLKSVGNVRHTSHITGIESLHATQKQEEIGSIWLLGSGISNLGSRIDLKWLKNNYFN